MAGLAGHWEMFSISNEIGCYVTCISDSGMLPWLLASLFMALLLFVSYLNAKTPGSRISSFIAAQLCMLASIGIAVSSMHCSRMLTIEIYTAYAGLSTLAALLLPRVYQRVLIGRHMARPIAEIMEWPQAFANKVGNNSNLNSSGTVDVYYYDSAIPRAFASGKAIFLSIGLIEIMDMDELKAILAHEVWHLRHRTGTPILRNLSMITFTRNCTGSELERLADTFAAKTVSRNAVESARAKLS